MNLTATRPSSVSRRSLVDRSLAWLRATSARLFALIQRAATATHLRVRALADRAAIALGTSPRVIALTALAVLVLAFILLAGRYLRPPTR